MENITNAVINLAEKHLGEFRIRNGQVAAKYCPFCHGGDHGDVYSFAVGLYNGAWNCMRGTCTGMYSDGKKVEGDFKELCDYFGENFTKYTATPKLINKSSKKNYVRPDPELLKPITDKIITYFGIRKISEDTLKDFNISADDKGNIVFPFYRDNVLTYVKYRKPEKVVQGPKEWMETNTEPILFGMDKVSFNKPLIITEGECFPPNAEILTENGWKRFDEYNKTDKVCIVDDKFNAYFETPLAFVKKEFNGNLCRVDIGGNYVSETTPNHNIVTIDRKNVLHKIKACELYKGCGYNIPTVVNVNGNGINLSNDEIALYLAVSADCTIDIRKTTRHSRFAVKKKRKYDRMKGILNRLNIPYTDTGLHDNGYYYIGFKTPDFIKSKFLPWSWMVEASLDQRKFIIEEMVWWDGNHVTNRNQYEFSSKEIRNITVMQTIAHTCGYMSTIMEKYIEYNGKVALVYKLSILKSKDHVSCQRWFPKQVPYNGKVYCVNVSTGMILVKQENKITVSGNCDALSIYEAGCTNVVSVPAGCNNMEWITNCWDWLDKFQQIILFGDADEPGQEMVSTLMKRLGEDRCLIPDEYPEFYVNGKDYNRCCKDANEILYAYGPEVLKTLVESCQPAPVEGVLNLADVPIIDPTSVPRIYSKIPELDNMIGGFGEGTLTILTGKRGQGKSTIGGSFILEAIEQGVPACIYSGELNASNVLEWICLQATESQYIETKKDPRSGKLFAVTSIDIQNRIRKWINNKLYVYDNSYAPNCSQAEAILRVFTLCARRYGCRMFLCDNVMSALISADEENRAQAKFAAELKAFSVKFKASVLCVCHTRKTQQGAKITNDDISGSSALSNLADTVLNIAKPDIIVLKNRAFGTTGTIECCYNPANRRIYSKNGGDRAVFSWDHTGLRIPDDMAIDHPEFRVQDSVPEELLSLPYN